MVGVMQLSEWLKLRNITAAEFAGRIGVSPMAVSRYLSGQRRPDWDIVLPKIVKETGGAVTANDFLSPPVPQQSVA